MTTKIRAVISKEPITLNWNDTTSELNTKSCIGTKQGEQLRLSLYEALYLHEKEKIELVSEKNRKISELSILKKIQKMDPGFTIKYAVWKDLRNRGYIVKTALKFGAEFRVYDRGVKPGEDHAKWIVFPVSEAQTLTWHEFSAKNRVAHSTKKRLLIGVVDDENEVSYWEIRWVRP